jgi:hypothetical protein
MALSKHNIKTIKITTYILLFVLSMLYINWDKFKINSASTSNQTNSTNVIQKDTIDIDTSTTFENRPQTGEIKF